MRRRGPCRRACRRECGETRRPRIEVAPLLIDAPAARPLDEQAIVDPRDEIGCRDRRIGAGSARYSASAGEEGRGGFCIGAGVGPGCADRGRLADGHRNGRNTPLSMMRNRGRRSARRHRRRPWSRAPWLGAVGRERHDLAGIAEPVEGVGRAERRAGRFRLGSEWRDRAPRAWPTVSWIVSQRLLGAITRSSRPGHRWGGELLPHLGDSPIDECVPVDAGHLLVAARRRRHEAVTRCEAMLRVGDRHDAVGLESRPWRPCTIRAAERVGQPNSFADHHERLAWQ